MASSASDLLKLELQADGENDTTWGSKANVLFERMEQAIAGTVSVSLDSLGGAGYTLDDTQYSKGSGATAEAHRLRLNLSGTMNSNENVTVPARTHLYAVYNGTSGSYVPTVKTSAGTGVVVPQGQAMVLWCDGTNVVNFLDCFLDNSFTLADNTDTTKQLMFQLSGITSGQTRTMTVPDVDFTPATITGQFAKGGDIASASPLVIDTDGNYFDVTGTTNFAVMTVAAGRLFILQFDGALTITHGASIDLPGEANITTAAGDRMICFSEAANVVQVLSYFPAAGWEPADADTLKADTAAALTAGFYQSADHNYGEIADSGTLTVDLRNEGFCKASLPAAGSTGHTIAPDASRIGAQTILLVSGAGGSYSLTTSGFDKVFGNFDTGADKKHELLAKMHDGFSILYIDEVA